MHLGQMGGQMFEGYMKANRIFAKESRNMFELREHLHLLFEMDGGLECCTRSWHMSSLHQAGFQSNAPAVCLPFHDTLRKRY